MGKLSNDQIDAMEPGRKLDEAVAHHVLSYGLATARDMAADGSCRPSSDWEDLKDICETMGADGYGLLLVSWPNSGVVTVEFALETHRFCATGASLPEAASKAALKAVFAGVAR